MVVGRRHAETRSREQARSDGRSREKPEENVGKTSTPSPMPCRHPAQLCPGSAKPPGTAAPSPAPLPRGQRRAPAVVSPHQHS